jgi:protein-tyrosine phosphatase
MRTLFICTGNLCRSPVAEKLLRQLGGVKFEARSRGTAAQPYTRMPKQVRAFLAHSGVNDIEHKPWLVTGEDIDWADLVLVMETAHFEDVSEQFPQSMRKMHLFLEYCGMGKELQDPMGGSEKAFTEILGRVREAVVELVKRG